MKVRLSGDVVKSNQKGKPPAGFRRLLEQEKRGSFLLEKETPAEYVHIRSNLKSFHSTSEVTPRRSSITALKDEEEKISIVPMRTSGLLPTRRKFLQEKVEHLKIIQ